MLVNCAVCDTEIDRKPGAMKKSRSGLFFCTRSHKTQALHMARNGDQRFQNLIPDHYKSDAKCSGCGKKVRQGTRSCSTRCRRQIVKEESLLEWQANPSIASSGSGSLLTRFRLYLLEEAQYKCTQCGWSEYGSQGTIPLEVDHIDGNWKNNTKTNLRVLCPNCHSLTSNYKGYNSGNPEVEESRYKYYKDKNWW